MTVEIRELIIEARVSEQLPSHPGSGSMENRDDEDALIQKIIRQVLSQLHDEMRGMR